MKNDTNASTTSEILFIEFIAHINAAELPRSHVMNIACNMMFVLLNGEPENADEFFKAFGKFIDPWIDKFNKCM